MSFADRLTRLLARDGITQADLAKELDLTAQAVHFWSIGRNMPRRTALVKLADYFRVPLEWLQNGVGGDYPPAGTTPAVENEVIAIGGTPTGDEELVAIYKYSLQFSAGVGRIAPEWVALRGEPLFYTPRQLQALGVDCPERAKIAEVSGDSMYPTILDGDEILFEEYPDSRLGAHPIVDGGIYAISIGDDMKVKRLSKIKNGIRVRSDNSDAYPDEIYAGEECDQIRVYGRVVQLLRGV